VISQEEIRHGVKRCSTIRLLLFSLLVGIRTFTGYTPLTIASILSSDR